jgi:DNA-binding LytR/AlgR family response regulator
MTTDSPIKILIVEDEMLIGAKVSMLLTELDYEVTGIIPRAEEALLHLEENAPDIALLDIQLKGNMDGIALAQILLKDHRIPVVFLTANSDEATFQRAKLAKPYAFLEKPFKRLDLQRALELTVSRMADQILPPENEASRDLNYYLTDRIFVRHKEKMVKILLDHILYLEADRNYCRIMTKAKEYLLTMPMKTLEDNLPQTVFQRIHRSHIVNLMHVDEVDEGSIVVGGKTLALSKSYKKDFLTRIKSV